MLRAPLREIRHALKFGLRGQELLATLRRDETEMPRTPDWKVCPWTDGDREDDATRGVVAEAKRG